LGRGLIVKQRGRRMAEITFRDLAHAREILATQTGANFNPSIANAAQTAIMDFQQDISPLSPINSFQNLFGMGKTYTIDAPFDETVVIDSTGERTLPAVSMNSPAMTDNYTPELDQPYFSGPIATPGIDYNTQNVSVPGNTGPNNINYDMTSFYESPNTVAGVNTVQEVNQVEDPSSGRSIIDSVVDVAKLGPTGSALTVALDEEVPTSGRVGAGLFGLGNTLAGMAMGPVVGLLGLLGGGLNAMGAYHDVGVDGNLTGNQMTLTNNGTLYGLMDAPGGSFYQTGDLSNYNTIANAPANTMVNTGFGNFGSGLLTQAGQPGMDVNQAAYVAAMSQADDFSFGGDDSGGFSEGTSYGDEDSYG